jgi:hypothetical protein
VLFNTSLIQFRAGADLKSAGSGQAWALHCKLGLLRAWPGLGSGPQAPSPNDAGLAQKPGPRGLRLLGYVVKAPALSIHWRFSPQIINCGSPDFWDNISGKFLTLERPESQESQLLIVAHLISGTTFPESFRRWKGQKVKTQL